MTDEKERVDWSALMDAHGIEPDADTASPAVEPASREEVADKRGAARGRLVHVIVAVTALFSIAASAAVLIAILRSDDDGGGGAARAEAADPPMAAVGPRPAAFEQTTDGVTVVPPSADEPPPSAEEPPPAAKKPPPAAEPPPPAAEPPPAAAKKPPPVAEAPPSPAAKKPPPAAKKPPPAAESSPPGATTSPPAESPEPPDANLPAEPDKAAVDAAMAALSKDIAACATPAGISGDVGIKMRIEPDGKVAWASAKVQSSPFQACLDRLFKKARMPKSAKGATVRQTVALP